MSYSFKAVVFDLDGVITKTANVHAAAWKKVFDEYLKLREERDGEAFKEFTHDGDYLPFVDGKPRYEGVKSFLASRGIDIPFGDPSDGSEKETMCGLGNRKNDAFRAVLQSEGAEVYQSTVDFAARLKEAGIAVGVASSSKNCRAILESAGLGDFFATRIDGEVSVERGLRGKPEGDIFVVAGRELGAMPNESVVVEDATSGVAAGRNGGFGLVLGVARKNNQEELLNNGADCVVADLADIPIDWIEAWFQRAPRTLEDEKPLTINAGGEKILLHPSSKRAGINAFAGSDKRTVFFLDYDGTLTPIVDRPDLAILSPDMKDVVSTLAQKQTVAIVSGRMRADVEKLVGIEGIFYAGSHGCDIVGPGFSTVHPQVEAAIPVIDAIIKRLKGSLGDIPGIYIEEKKFSMAVHYRLVDESAYLSRIQDEVNSMVQEHDGVRLMSGKKVFEILPDVDWDKGKAIRWIMETLGIQWNDVSVVYIGDDVTDEYAFRAVRTRGTAILVSEKERASSADFRLSSVGEVKQLFENVIRLS